ncbi:MAG: hypothetical protein PHR77_10475 [Kiritimatiellae bacterium]|nr:hypothetical protein [Kiritimatiellia bacterium]MDD5522740.1 hypothetical protein [Kiritimatiellia bacterium]
MKKLSQVLAVLGILLALVAVVGRFTYDTTVFGYFLKPGMAAQSVLIAANTLLLLALLANSYNKNP